MAQLFKRNSAITIVQYQDIHHLVREDMQAVNTLIQQRLRSDVALINQLSTYIINSGGKRLRPMLTLLIARACGYTKNRHIDVAAIIEFIHTATLLHDDVVDESELRRGQDTANTVWGNQAAVLVGDFLYSRSFQMMVDVNDMVIMDILSSTTNVIAEGEVMQLLNCNDASTTETRYFDVIYAKTAKLFEAACHIGAVLAKLPDDQQRAIAKYGTHLGTAFQLVDDAMDYTSDAKAMGKNAGDDLAEGKPTLPLITALARSDGDDKALIRTAIEQGGREHIEQVMQIIETSQAIEYTLEKAEEESHKAISYLDNLQESDYKTALIELAKLSTQRKA